MEKDKPDAQLNRRQDKGEDARLKSLRTEGLSLWFDPSSKRWLKVIAWIVIAAFLHQDVVWAVGTDYANDVKLMFESRQNRKKRMMP